MEDSSRGTASRDGNRGATISYVEKKDVVATYLQGSNNILALFANPPTLLSICPGLLHLGSDRAGERENTCYKFKRHDGDHVKEFKGGKVVWRLSRQWEAEVTTRALNAGHE